MTFFCPPSRKYFEENSLFMVHHLVVMGSAPLFTADHLGGFLLVYSFSRSSIVFSVRAQTKALSRYILFVILYLYYTFCMNGWAMCFCN